MSSYGDRLALDSADFKVFIDSSTYEYTGDTISPEVSVFVVNGSALTSGIDFEVIYLNNIAPGRAAISVNGLGDYAGIFARLSFQIVRSPDNSIALPGSWAYQNGKLWLRYDADGWPSNCFLTIGGAEYYFDSEGYAATGCRYLSDGWHLFSEFCAHLKGWASTGGYWSYLDETSGSMKTGWVLINGSWYYLDGSGAMKTGWLLLGNTWYWLEPSGLMATGFKLVNGVSHHFSQSGSMNTGWFVNNGTWYCANASGAIRTGCFYFDSNWYLLDSNNNNGAMLEGFQSINGNCYYLDSDSGGALECNAWVFSQDAYAYYACSSGAIVLTGVMDSVGSIRLNDAEGKPIAGWTHTHTNAGARWGHVAIYVGNGMVMDNIGYIVTTSLAWWLNYYHTTAMPQRDWVLNSLLV